MKAVFEITAQFLGIIKSCESTWAKIKKPLTFYQETDKAFH
jgi:hypothetical protein